MVTNDIAALIGWTSRKPRSFAPIDVDEAGSVQQVGAELLEIRARKLIKVDGHLAFPLKSF